MVANKRNNTKSVLQFGDVRHKQLQKPIYLGSDLTDKGKWDTESRSHIRIGKEKAFPKLNNALKEQIQKTKRAELLYNSFHLV